MSLYNTASFSVPASTKTNRTTFKHTKYNTPTTTTTTEGLPTLTAFEITTSLSRLAPLDLAIRNYTSQRTLLTTTSALTTTILATKTKLGRTLARPLQRTWYQIHQIRASLASMPDDPTIDGVWPGWKRARAFYWDLLMQKYLLKQLEMEFQMEVLFLAWDGSAVEKEELRREIRRGMGMVKDEVVRGRRWQFKRDGVVRWGEMSVERGLWIAAFGMARGWRKRIGGDVWE
jgi:hypothetical protein